MNKLITFFLLVLLSKVNGQNFTGEVFLRDNSVLYLNQVYVTNINKHKTVLTSYNGDFQLYAEPGDVIRFTSIVTERKDITLTPQMLNSKKSGRIKGSIS